MKLIQLSKGFKAQIDDSDYDLVIPFRWYTNEYRKGIYRAMKNASESSPEMYMHRLIMNALKGQTVDHQDRNGLNNQRYNLRLCTHGQNLSNQGLHADNTSGLKGAYWSKKDCAWFSNIRHEGKTKFLGYFSTPKDAAKAYDEAALKFRGEFAATNRMLGLL